MKKNINFTIITVTYNAARHLQRCIDSVARQTYSNVEHIIIDGGSIDGTVDIALKNRSIRIVVSEPDRGIYDAMNKGIGLALGEYILFLNSDDELISPDTLTIAAQKLRSAGYPDVAYGGLDVERSDGRVVSFEPPQESEALEFMLLGCLPHQATFTRTSIFSTLGPFNTVYRYHADYEWFLRILSDENVGVKKIDMKVACFHYGGASADFDAAQSEVHGILDSSTVLRLPRLRMRLLQKYRHAHVELLKWHAQN